MAAQTRLRVHTPHHVQPTFRLGGTDTTFDPSEHRLQPQYAFPAQPGPPAVNNPPRYAPTKHLFDLVAEDKLRRKTPNGTLTDAYDGTTVGSDLTPHVNKHFVVHRPSPDASLAHNPFRAHDGALDYARVGLHRSRHGPLRPGLHDTPRLNPGPIDFGLSMAKWQENAAHHGPSVDSGMNSYNTPPPQMGAQYLGFNVMQPPSQQGFGPTASHELGGYGSHWSQPSFRPQPPVSVPRYGNLGHHGDAFAGRYDANYNIGPNSHAPAYGSYDDPQAPQQQLLGPMQNYSISDGPPPQGPPKHYGSAHQVGREPFFDLGPISNESAFTQPNVDPDVLLRSAHRLYEQLRTSIQQLRKASHRNEASGVQVPLPQHELLPEALRREQRQATRSYQSAMARQQDWHAPRSYPSSSSLRDSHGYSGPSPRRKIDSHWSGNLNYSSHWTGRHDALDGASPPLQSFGQHALRAQAPWPGFSAANHLHNVLLPTAATALEAINRATFQTNIQWADAKLLAGSLSYLLADYQGALNSYSQILDNDPEHVYAITNLALALLALNRQKEAETHWRHALKLDPSHISAVEHLVSMLCSLGRHKEAVDLINNLQRILRTQDSPALKNGAQPMTFTAASTSSGDLPPFPSSVQFHGAALSQRYQCAPDENGRFVGLLHAKGNILYNLKDHKGASKAFEEVVLTATGQIHGGIDRLIHTINGGLSYGDANASKPSLDRLLLTPDRALQTARLCYPPSGGLPGLQEITSPAELKSAINVTSNSLLSLAKIFQDSMNPNSAASSLAKPGFGVTEILALYYLSFSLQPSPSTANNVGILLAGIQATSSKALTNGEAARNEPCNFPGVVSGSGVALALMYYKYGLNLDPKHAHLYTNLGSLLKDIGQLGYAIQMYEKAVACDGSFDIALANLANAVKDQGKVNEAITYYKRAVAVNPDFAEAVCGLANALNSVCNWAGRGGTMLARCKYDRWHVGENNELLDARIANTRSGWIKRVLEIVENQLKDGESWGRNLLGEDQIQLLADAIARHEPTATAASTRSQKIKTYLKNLNSRPWAGARLVRLIERAIRRIGWQWYQDKYVRGSERAEATYARPAVPSGLSVPSAPTILPFHTFTFPMTARQIRLISQRNGLRVSSSTLKSPWLPRTVFAPPRPPSPQLIVGYLSSDFNNHPLAHLMQSVFGMHDKTTIKAVCYATTPSDNSIHRLHIEREAPLFHDVSSWSTSRIVSQVVADGCHILINLNGYTRGARNEVFAARPAPVQMAFMGFAGSLGAEWCDYLLTDEIASPPETLRQHRSNVDFADLEKDDNFTSVMPLDDEQPDWVYQENVVYTRYTFFCCDHAQSASAGTAASSTLLTIPPHISPTSFEGELAHRMAMRRHMFPELPPNTIIFANFNQLYKIDPATFRTWLRILSRVPNSILWLLRFPDAGEAHLLRTARQWAGDNVACRVRFTDVAAKGEHIRRACIADLFLDTPECNAHTTAADCLWSGTPLLTLRRYEWKMASRMAASILAGALGVPADEDARAAAKNGSMSSRERVSAWEELVATSEEAYEENTVRLAKGLAYWPDPDGCGYAEGRCTGRLFEMRKMIWEKRYRSPLFDTRRWVRDLEAAYQECWRRWECGEGGDVRLTKLLAGKAKGDEL